MLGHIGFVRHSLTMTGEWSRTDICLKDPFPKQRKRASAWDCKWFSEKYSVPSIGEPLLSKSDICTRRNGGSTDIISSLHQGDTHTPIANSPGVRSGCQVWVFGLGIRSAY